MEYTCDCCGTKEEGRDEESLPRKWDWQFIVLNKQHRGKRFLLCRNCQKKLNLRRAKTKEEFLLECLEN